MNKAEEKINNKDKSYLLMHAHTDVSNATLRDCIIKPKQLVDYTHEIGLNGVIISDHEILSAHVKAHRYFTENREKFRDDFKVGYGDEIYLVDREVISESREENKTTKFYHFLLIAKNQRGYEKLKEISSQAWKNGFKFRGLDRRPTYYDELKEMMDGYQGDIIATTACLGSRLNQLILKYHESNQKDDKLAIHNEIMRLIDIFGKDDLYLELQPSATDEQRIVNDMLLKLGKGYGLRCTVATDAHYLNPSYAKAHENYLRASDGEREVASFYATTYVFSHDELLEYFDEELLLELEANTMRVHEQLEEIEFKRVAQIPLAHIPEYNMHKYSKKIDLDKYDNIKFYINSTNDIDRYYIHEVLNGMEVYNQELNDRNLERVDIELGELRAISAILEQPMSSYFVLMKELVDIIWEVSLVGVSRGSASCFYTNYLLGIVQVNALDYDLPYWRFLSKERVDGFPDIDIDSMASKRLEISDRIKEHFGEENVLNIGTYSTEGNKQTIKTACRSLGIDKDEMEYIANLAPAEKGFTWDIHDILYGNPEKDRKKSVEFIEEVDKYDGLKETMLNITGLISGRSQHASGLIIYPDGYLKQNSMMRTTKGLEVSQFDADDSEYMGGIKYDLLTISALDKIYEAMMILLDMGKIEWQGNLRNTYNKYFHPDVLDLTSSGMYDLLMNGDIPEAFQYEAKTGRQTLEKLQARSFDELSASNALMRLTTEGEQPIDKFIKHRDDIEKWYQEMAEYGLTEEEQEIMNDALSGRYGICDTQELLMSISMREDVSSFDLVEANHLRKAFAKKDPNKQKIQEELFYKKCKEQGTSDNLAKYVWDECFDLQKG